MQEIEIKLRRGMDDNKITGETQDKIVQAITSFALYGFPESHAASFALIAYASAYLKCHYLAAFTAALLNNQPMGFYHPATIIKDAQRHGLKINPIDVTRSDWLCTLERGDGSWGLGDGDWALGAGVNEVSGDQPASIHESPMIYSTNNGANPHPLSLTYPPTPVMRLGLRYVKGFREEPARAIVLERAKRSFTDVDDLHNRVPELRKDEMRKLAGVGALNFIRDQEAEGGRQEAEGRRQINPQSAIRNPQSLHRRSALWKVERATREAGPLLKDQKDPIADSPLPAMTIEERVNADFRGTGVTIGRHPMAYRREELNKLGIKRSIDLLQIRNGVWVKIAGWVIVRQRPGTAKGFMFLTMEDETGVANVIITPDTFDRNRAVLVNQPLLLIEGPLQNQDNVIHVRARRIEPLSYAIEASASHDFH